MQGKIISFEAVYKDGELLPEPCVVFMGCGDAIPLGEGRKTAYNPKTWRYGAVCGFFVSYEGVEYGTITMSQSGFISKCACGNEGLFDKEFAIEFD